MLGVLLNFFLMFLDIVLILLSLLFLLVHPIRDSISLRSVCFCLLESLGQRLNLTLLLLNSLTMLQKLLTDILQLPKKE